MIKGNENPGSNVYFLRTIEDANRIGKDVKGKNVLILGSSFIGILFTIHSFNFSFSFFSILLLFFLIILGIETASCIINSAKQVTVNGFEKVPFERVLGLEIGGILQKVFITTHYINMIISKTETQLRNSKIFIFFLSIFYCFTHFS